MNLDSKIYVAGHKGLVGSALIRYLNSHGYKNIIMSRFNQIDLRNQSDVIKFFEKERPEYVFLAAAKVGGIKANSDYPAQFIYDNLMIQSNIIHNSYKFGVKTLLFLGSSCIYPKNCFQPIKEEYLLSGLLEPTNEYYAIAKIAGLKMCEAYNKQYGTNFISCMPTNLYGPNDNFDLESSHVLPALIAKFYKAKEENLKEVVIWGSGKPMREFLFVEDLAEALIFLMKNYSENSPINIGVGKDITIFDLTKLIRDLIGFKGELVFDSTKPDGTSKKILDVSKMNKLGWQAKTSLKDGILKTIEWYEQNKQKGNSCNFRVKKNDQRMVTG